MKWSASQHSPSYREDTHMRLGENATAAGKRYESEMIDFIEWDRLGLADPHWLFADCNPLALWIRLKGKIDNSALRFLTLDIISGTNSGKSRFKTWFPQLLQCSSAFLFLPFEPQYDRSTETVLSSGVDIIGDRLVRLHVGPDHERVKWPGTDPLGRGQGSDQ